MKSMKPVFAAYFDQGQVPTIDCVFLNTVDLGNYNPSQLVAALQSFANQFARIWGASCNVSLQRTIRPGNWGMVFIDDPDVAGALGYHDLTKDGLPLSKIFVKTTRDNGEEVSVTASHELCEALIDPGVQMIAQNLKNGVMYAYEVADAVEAEDFLVEGIPMTNFQYPAWFESFRKPNSVKFDHLGTCKKPFELRKGGYMSVVDHDGNWSQIFGSKAAEKNFRIGIHGRALRRDFRNNFFNSPLKKSKA